MISVDEARARILDGLSPVGREVVGLAEGWGRVLAAPVIARRDHPPADVSAMDGYAVRVVDAREGARLAVIGAAPAGRPFAESVGPGQAVRCFTGSVVPAGADGILIQENATPDGDGIRVDVAVETGRFIRRAGQDFASAATLIEAGRRMKARDVALAAAADHPWLTVHRQPVVAILTTGDELSLPGEPVGAGGIVSANTHGLAALVRAEGGRPITLPLARDEPDAIGATLRGTRADLILTSGGVSVGDHDAVVEGLRRQGMEVAFWRVAMRPGKPLMFGRLGSVPVIGLPGNPVSAFVCAMLFARPALRRLLGRPEEEPRCVLASLGADLPANDARADYLRGRLSPGERGPVVTPDPVQDSAMLAALARADVLIPRAPHAPAVEAGEIVTVMPIEDADP